MASTTSGIPGRREISEGERAGWAALLRVRAQCWPSGSGRPRAWAVIGLGLARVWRGTGVRERGRVVAWLTASHFASIMGCWMPGAFSSQEGSSGSTWLVEHSASPLTLSTVMKCGDGL